MHFQFNEKKAAQAAAHLLERAGGSMGYLMLLKLLYLADRKNLLERGLLITGDRLVAMKNGMVLSQVLDLVRGQQRGTWWPRYIRPSGEYDIELVDGSEKDELSEFEVGLLDEAFEKFGAMDPWQLVDHLHESLEEWKVAWGGRQHSQKVVEVSPEEVMRAGKISEQEIADRQLLAAETEYLTH
jgi:uncharacterized phage-associated protein